MNLKSIDIPIHGSNSPHKAKAYVKPSKERPEPPMKLKRGKRIALVSDKRKEQLKEYKKVRAEYLKTHPRCEVFPNLASVEIHHKKGRIGKLLTDTTYFMAVSRKGHQHIEMNPDLARANGWIVNRYEKK